jgi:hypothetical protein
MFMRIKILYVCFTLSFFINMALCIHLLKREPVCGHIHLDEIDRTRDVVPNEETAVRLAKEKRRNWIADSLSYTYRVLYNEPSYEWIVFIQCREEEGCIITDGGTAVWLRRDYGVSYR